MAQSAKELVKNLFELRDLPRAPFIPWVCSFAAQLEQVQVKAMLSDAGLLSRSLLNAQKLFGYDAIVNVFDPSLEAEACGCKIDYDKDGQLPKVISHPLNEGATLDDLDIANFDKRGRLPAILEATKRLKIIRGKEVAIIGFITGPLTIAKHLKGESLTTIECNQNPEDTKKLVTAAGSISLKLCRLYCELGVDVIVITEEMLGRLSPVLSQMLVAPLRSIWNVSRFYNVHSLILSKSCIETDIEPILSLQADGVALSGDIDYTHLRDAALKRKQCCAHNIPTSLLLNSTFQANASPADYSSTPVKGLFLSTEWEVPYATDVNKMHGIMRIIRSN